MLSVEVRRRRGISRDIGRSLVTAIALDRPFVGREFSRPATTATLAQRAVLIGIGPIFAFGDIFEINFAWLEAWRFF